MNSKTISKRSGAAAIAALATAFAFAPAQVAAQGRAASQTAAVAPAAWEGQAKTFVQGLIGQLTAVSAQGLPAAEEQRQLEAVLARNLAVRQMGGLLLGGARASATPEQLAEYNRLIPAFLAHTFASQIDDLVAQNLQIGAVTTRSPREVVVATSFVRRANQTTVRVNWRVIQQGEALQLVDASVDGVSKLTVLREEFASLVKAQGFDALLARLRAVA